MSTHSIFGPSSASRYLICPASVHHQQPDSGHNEFTLPGSVMHQVAETCLMTDEDPSDFVGNFIRVDPKDKTIGMTYTEEMRDTVQKYLDYFGMLKEQYPTASISVEERVSLEWLDPKLYILSGTADLVFRDLFNELVICDLKTGKGVSVAPTSPQLKLYALMAAGSEIETYESIRLIIVQPNDKYGEEFKEAFFEPKELLEWLHDTLIPAIVDAQSDNPPYGPSEASCRWCDYSGQCPAQAKYALSIASGEFDQFSDTDICQQIKVSDLEYIDSDRLSYMLDGIPAIRVWADAVEEKALTEALNGNEIPGYKIIETNGLKKWNPDIDIEKTLYEKIKIRKKDIIKPKIRTPKQILALAPKIKHPEIEKLIIQPKGKLKLVPTNDKREAVDPVESAGSDFDLFA